MKYTTLKYFSTIFIFAIAILSAWWLWNYYMQSPWTRDGKLRAEVVNITPEVSGLLKAIMINDNQFVTKGTLLFRVDPEPYQIALDNANAALEKSQAELNKAIHEAQRRRSLPKNVISAEVMDEANLQENSMRAEYKSAKALVEQAKWNIKKTNIYSPTDGYITNLHQRIGSYANVGEPIVALVDANSFYVMGYFEETKLKHIQPGNGAIITLYSGNIRLQGEVESIGRAIYDQSIDSNSGLLMDVKPSVPWVRLAQRVPVRIKIIHSPENLTLVAGTTCTISIQP